MPIVFDNVTIDGTTINYGQLGMILNYSVSNTTRTISLPLANTVNVEVNWGDETSNTYTTSGLKSHTYASNGFYQVQITGTLTGYGSTGVGANVSRLINVVSFGNIGLISLQNAFANANNLTSVPAELPSTINDLSYMFRKASNVNDPNISLWNVSNVSNLAGTFNDVSNFNQNLSSWNTTNVTSLNQTFAEATSFNGNITNWNTSNVTSLAFTFSLANTFNQPIGNWNIANVLDIGSAFRRANTFNQPIGNWNTSKVTEASWTFANAFAFNQDIGNWNTGNISNMARMFSNATVFNQDLSDWCVTNIPSLPDNFDTGSALENINRPDWGNCP